MGTDNAPGIEDAKTIWMISEKMLQCKQKRQAASID